MFERRDSRGPALAEIENDGRAPRSLLEYWNTIVRRRAVALSSLGAALVIAVLYLAIATPDYQATTTLQIDRQGPDILTFKDVVGVDPSYAAYQDFYQTQYKILQSRAVLRLATDRLELSGRPEYAQRKKPVLSRLIGGLKAALRGGPTAADPEEAAILFLEEGLAIRPVRDSQLVVVAFTDPSPELARDVAQSIAEAYLQFSFDARYGTTSTAREFLTKEVARVQIEIDEFERKLQEISQDKEIFAMSDGVQDISEQALADLNRRYIEARSSHAVAKARYESVRRASPESLPEVLNSTLVNNLRQQYAELERQASLMSGRFKPEWPPAMQLHEELEKARERLVIETAMIAERVHRVAERDLARAEAETESLRLHVEGQKNEVQRVNLDAIEFASLRAAIETKRTVLSDMVARQSQTESSERLQDTSASNIRIVDLAEVPREPVRPKKAMTLLLAFVLGSGLGVAFAFGFDYLDNTIVSEDDLRRATGWAVLGHVPVHTPEALAGQPTEALAAAVAPDLMSHTAPRSNFAEAFKNLRTSILLASPDQAPGTMVVSSCEPTAGKSTVALNLAIVLTQLGRRVLIIDADLRRPRLHLALGLSTEVGLSSFLSGNAEAEELPQETGVPGLDAIASGPIPPNPSELLDSQRLPALIHFAQRARAYDHVIFDSPPSVSISDALILGTRVDGVIMVARCGQTGRESLQHAASRLRQGRVKVIGAVLNAANLLHDRYSYYGRYGYYRAKDDEPTPAAGPGLGRLLSRRSSGSGRRRSGAA